MSYIILMSITFIVGIFLSKDIMPFFEKAEQKVLELLAKRLK